VRNALGPNLEIAVSGGAKLDAKIMQFFEALGLDVYEGYGEL
jgi:long-subunit acyl-CoA synthetase (AMP-forming)